MYKINCQKEWKATDGQQKKMELKESGLILTQWRTTLASIYIAMGPKYNMIYLSVK